MEKARPWPCTVFLKTHIWVFSISLFFVCLLSVFPSINSYLLSMLRSFPYIKQMENSGYEKLEKNHFRLLFSRPSASPFRAPPPSSHLFISSVLFIIRSRSHQSSCFLSAPCPQPHLTALANPLTATHVIWFPGRQPCLFLESFGYPYLHSNYHSHLL